MDRMNVDVHRDDIEFTTDDKMTMCTSYKAYNPPYFHLATSEM